MAEKGSLLPNNNDNNYHKKEGSCEESLFVRRHSDTDGCDGEASPIYRILGFLGRVITACSPPIICHLLRQTFPTLDTVTLPHPQH